MPTPRILYSTNTLLAYIINDRYYGNLHYVYVSPRFGSNGLTADLFENPSTSRPNIRYQILRKEVETGDQHGMLIKENRLGLLQGVEEKYNKGVITAQQRDEIRAIIEQASCNQFKPLLYVMAYSEVQHLIKEIPVNERASVTSEEWLIEELPRDLFDLLNLD